MNTITLTIEVLDGTDLSWIEEIVSEALYEKGINCNVESDHRDDAELRSYESLELAENSECVESMDY